jgi:hypothetical protein
MGKKNRNGVIYLSDLNDKRPDEKIYYLVEFRCDKKLYMDALKVNSISGIRHLVDYLQDIIDSHVYSMNIPYRTVEKNDIFSPDSERGEKISYGLLYEGSFSNNIWNKVKRLFEKCALEPTNIQVRKVKLSGGVYTEMNIY